MRNKKGFTLIEIMMVVGIIGLLVAIAFPSLARARITANESAAKASLKTIITALENYRADQNPPTFPNNLAALGGLLPPYLEPVLSSGSKQGYNFAYNASPVVNVAVNGVVYPTIPSYSLGAMPYAPLTSGNKTYYANATGIVYEDVTAPYGDPGMGSYLATPPAGFN